MRTMLLCVGVLVLAATAMGQAASAPAPAPAAATWKPRKVTKEDKKGIDALFKADEEAWKKEDLVAASANYDFPVYMATDDSKGNTYGETWDNEKWNKVMAGSMSSMPKDAKFAHKATYFFVTDSMAFVNDNVTMTAGKEKHTFRNGGFVELKDGKWRWKMMAEGGWGDVMPPAQAEAPAHSAEPPPGAKTATK